MAFQTSLFSTKPLFSNCSFSSEASSSSEASCSSDSQDSLRSSLTCPKRSKFKKFSRLDELRQQYQNVDEGSKFRQTSRFDEARENPVIFTQQNTTFGSNPFNNPFNKKRKFEGISSSNKKQCLGKELDAQKPVVLFGKAVDKTPPVEIVEPPRPTTPPEIKIVHEVIDLLSDSEPEPEPEETEEEKEFLAEMAEIEKFEICLSPESKIKAMKENAELVEYKEWAEYRKAGDAKAVIIEENPILKENLVDREPGYEIEHRVRESQAIRLYEHLEVYRRARKARKGIEETFEERPKHENVPKEMLKICKKLLETTPFTSSYAPPEKRTRIMRNISLDPMNKIPVYCDLPVEEGDTVDIPDTLAFEFINQNEIPQDCDPDLIEAVEIAEKPEHSINCGCEPDENGKMVKCSENPNCRCYKLNKKLKHRQKLTMYREFYTEFSTFGKIFVRDVDHFFDSVAFSCSGLCGCKGVCDNNVMYTIDHKVNSFEVYRYDEKGFGVRATSLIPHATPVLEFTGEVVDHNSIIMEDSEDYAFSIIGKENDVKLKNWLIKNAGFKKEYSEHFKKVWGTDWYIDPKRKGNQGRFVTHGCHPNMAMVRVFQNGFLPHNCKCVMIALEDIWPGKQICFDYGKAYVEVQLQGKCLCDTIGCVTKKKAMKKLVNAPWLMIYESYQKNYSKNRAMWNEYIHRRLDPRVYDGWVPYDSDAVQVLETPEQKEMRLSHLEGLEFGRRDYDDDNNYRTLASYKFPPKRPRVENAGESSEANPDSEIVINL